MAKIQRNKIYSHQMWEEENGNKKSFSQQVIGEQKHKHSLEVIAKKITRKSNYPKAVNISMIIGIVYSTLIFMIIRKQQDISPNTSSK